MPQDHVFLKPSVAL